MVLGSLFPRIKEKELRRERGLVLMAERNNEASNAFAIRACTYSKA